MSSSPSFSFKVYKSTLKSVSFLSLTKRQFQNLDTLDFGFLHLFQKYSITSS